MKMHCPTCQRTFENALECEACGARLEPSGQRRATNAGLEEFAGSDAYRWESPLPQPGLAAAKGRGGFRFLAGFLVIAGLAALSAAAALVWFGHG